MGSGMCGVCGVCVCVKAFSTAREGLPLSCNAILVYVYVYIKRSLSFSLSGLFLPSSFFWSVLKEGGACL